MVKLLTKLIIGILLCIALLGKTNTAVAQVYFVNPLRGTYFQPNLGIKLGTFFNQKDFLLDFGVGLDELGYDFSATASFSFRPYIKTVRYPVADHLYYQTEEKLYQISIDLEKRFYFLSYGKSIPQGKIGIYVLGKFAYFWGKYSGFNEARNKTFIINPGAGLSWQLPKVLRISLGYLYFPQNPFVKPHMLQLKFNLFIGNNSTEN